jgi:hypothetical protein
MKEKCAVLLLAAVMASISSVSAQSENPINVSIGKEFTIALDSNPGSTGADWWAKFDTQYLCLVNWTFIPGNFGAGKTSFTFKSKRTGNTEVMMLLLRPWVGGDIGDRKIFPVFIKSHPKERCGCSKPCREEQPGMAFVGG